MGKLIPVLVAGGGTTAVSVGGFYLVKESGIGTGTPAEPGDAQSQTSLEFENVGEFKKQPAKSTCVSENFTGLEAKENADVISSTAPSTSIFFKSDSVEDSLIKSCLKIEYKKTTYSEEKWTGKFTWLRAFARGDEGFVTFNVVETSDKEDGKLKFTGIFYLVGKKDDKSKWEIKYRKEVGDDKQAHDTTTLAQYFPKASDTLKTFVGGEYWGFLDESNDKLNKICKTDGCGGSGSSSPLVKKEFTWTKGTDESEKLSGWSKNLTWWSNLYSGTDWTLTDKIKDFNGKWSSKPESQ